MTEEIVGLGEFRAEVRVRLGAIESQLQPLTQFMLARSGEQEAARTLERRVYKAETALHAVSRKVDRIWLGAAGVVAVIEVLRFLPAGTLARIFGG